MDLVINMISNKYIHRHDEYLVRWEDGKESETHIVSILWDNKVHDTALCGFTPEKGWGRRGGLIKITETKCERCNEIARMMEILK